MTKKITVNAPKKKITVNSTTKVVTVVTQGAQGASFAFDETNRVDGSIIRYSESSGKYIADSAVTPTELTDGGNF